MPADRKLSRKNNSRQGHAGKKRSFGGNRHTSDKDTEMTSTAAKKIKDGETEFDVRIDPSANYSFIHWSVFLTLQTILICKVCKKDIKFYKTNMKTVGYELEVSCGCVKSTLISTSPKIRSGYEINRRLVYVMRLLGVGMVGINNFLGLMDMTSSGFGKQGYYNCINHILLAVSAVCEAVFKKAVKEEQELNIKNGNTADELAVSGDGSWPKRGFSSLLGLVSLIGKYSNKIVDVIVKSSYCQGCKTCQYEEGTIDYEAWWEDHEKDCTANHEGSAGLMEVKGVIEMFERSVSRYNVKYEFYIGDGDTKTFKQLVDSKPYNDNPVVKKKECVLHVKKRMFKRAKEAKKQLTLLKKAKKALEKTNEKDKKKAAAKNKEPVEKTLSLTGAVMSKLSLYYQLAILQNSESVEGMKKAIWCTYYHMSSTDSNPQHEFCPTGVDSWCKYRKAEAENKLKNYKHPPAFDNDIQELLKPIYEDLTTDDLLERCVGANTQNNNESFNACVWNIVPKHMFAGKKIIEIAAYSAACVFNEGSFTILKVMETMGVHIGYEAKQHALNVDEVRVSQAERRSSLASKETRTALRNTRILLNDQYEEEEGVVYGAGIAD